MKIPQQTQKLEQNNQIKFSVSFEFSFEFCAILSMYPSCAQQRTQQQLQLPIATRGTSRQAGKVALAQFMFMFMFMFIVISWNIKRQFTQPAYSISKSWRVLVINK